jgi:hypothetical protein
MIWLMSGGGGLHWKISLDDASTRGFLSIDCDLAVTSKSIEMRARRNLKSTPEEYSWRWMWPVLILGLGLRLAQYAGRSLWLDEALLALNIIHRPIGGLFRVLDYHQGAPLGFLLLEKMATKLVVMVNSDCARFPPMYSEFLECSSFPRS